MDVIKIILPNRERRLKYLSTIIYISIFFIFSGANFIRFEVFNFTLNIGRLCMIAIPAITIFLGPEKICQWKCNITLLIIFSLFSLISFFWSKDYVAWFTTNSFILFGTLDVVSLLSIKRKISIDNIVFSIQLSLLFNCLIYIVNLLFTCLPDGVATLYGNVNDLATALLFGVNISVISYLRDIRKIYSIIVAILYIVTIIFTDSRAVMFSIIIELILLSLALISLKILNKVTIDNFVVSIQKIIPFVAIIVIIAFYFVIKDIQSYKDPINSNQVRINLLKNGIVFFERSNFLGVGAGNSVYYMENYAVFNTFYRGTHILPLHNLWMELLTEYGIVGFVIFITNYLNIISNLISSSISKTKINYCGLVMLLYYICFIIAVISSSIAMTKEWFFIPYFLVFSLFQNDEVNFAKQKHERNII